MDTYDVEPVELPNLYHGSPVTVFGRYRGRGGEAKAVISGDVLGRAISQRVAIELPQGDGGSPEIERMWALKRVQRLLRDADRMGSRDSVVSEIIRLGEAYSIVTEYTSFLVLENDGEYQRWNIDRRNATRLERDRASRERVNERLRSLRDQALAGIGPAPEAVKPAAPEQAAQAPATRPGDLRFLPSSPSSNRSGGGGGGGGGAGAIDPVTGAIILGVGGAALLRRRRDERDG